ncbi:hypothetical protein [Streptomyces sp. A5-4]|uniref:hypothetical protein n=1 Tax=Streptomyces sp. A5-4 TaxID=3384771 RepID=UPI003DA9C7F8
MVSSASESSRASASGAEIGPDPAAALSSRAQEAVRIATEAGRQLGLTVDIPSVLHDIYNVLVHLAPSPDLVNRDFTAPAPNRLWVTEQTVHMDQKRRRNPQLVSEIYRQDFRCRTLVGLGFLGVAPDPQVEGDV